MTYFANFLGEVWITPRLNAAEIAYLTRFADTRRMRRRSGPYTTEPFDLLGPLGTDVLDVNEPAEGQPDLYCQWIPTPEGEAIAWNRSSKFPFASRWMEYIVEHFLAPGARLSGEFTSPVVGRYYAPEFQHLTFDHVVNGTIEVVPGDGPKWRIVVEDKRVSEYWASPEADSVRPHAWPGDV